MSTTVADSVQGVVFMVIWDQPQGWNVEATRFHGINEVICEVITD